MIIKNANNNSDSDNDNNNNSDNCENNDNDDNDNNQLPVDSPHKGPIKLNFDFTFVRTENNSRVSDDFHMPHVTSLWCDIFTQHRHHVCIVESSHE